MAGDDESEDNRAPDSPADSDAPAPLDPKNPESVRQHLEYQERRNKASRATIKKFSSDLAEIKAILLEKQGGGSGGQSGSGQSGSLDGTGIKKSESLATKARKGGGGKSKEKTGAAAKPPGIDDDIVTEEIEDDENMEQVEDTTEVTKVKNNYGFTAKIQAPVPKLEKGMLMKEYRRNVNLWQKLVQQTIRKREQAAILLAALPNQDQHGGLQQLIMSKFDIDEFDTDDGVKKFLDEIEEITGGTSFNKMNTWIHKFFNFKQQKDWSMTRYLTEFRRLFQEGTEFDITFPSQFLAGALCHFQTEVNGAAIAQITSTLDWKHAKSDKKVEDLLRQFAATRDAAGVTAGATGATKRVLLTDALGYAMPGQEQQEGDAEYEDFILLTKEDKKKVPGHKLKVMKEAARRRGDCTVCFEKGHRADTCKQKLTKEEKASLRVKILDQGKYWQIADSDGNRRWEHKVDGKVEIVDKIPDDYKLKKRKRTTKPAHEQLLVDEKLPQAKTFKEAVRKIPEELRMFDDDDTDGEGREGDTTHPEPDIGLRAGVQRLLDRPLQRALGDQAHSHGPVHSAAER